ncbi:MAG: VWA domain-containing protein [Bacteroidales bacterium]|nr:VWA domain-containing protein [Bacteroidales bacterium]
MFRILLFVFAFLFFNFKTTAQEYKYSVKIYNTKGQAYPGVKVWFDNKTTGEQIVKNTNNKGEAVFMLNSEGVWALNLIGMHDTQIIRLKLGVQGEGSQVITYDLETILAEQEFRRKRTLTTFTIEDQSSLKIESNIPKYMAVITVILKGDKGELYKDIPVSLVSVTDKKIYESKTDKSSKVKFLVPNNQKYAVDVEEAINYSFTMDLGNYTNSTIELGFKPTNIVEHIINDTINQEITPEIEATSTRSFITIRIAGGSNGFFAGESVYLSQVNSTIVYKGITDENGDVSFLLPNGNRYMINFEFQHNVDVIDLNESHGRRTIRRQIIYTPIPELEHPEQFIPTPQELFLVNLNSLKSNETYDEGIQLKWGNENVTPNAKEAVLQLNISVKDDGTQNTKRSNIAFVIDKSGSMCGENMIDALKQSLIEYVKRLPQQDKISIITFESEAFLESEMGYVAGNEMLIPIISDITAGGGTDIYKGLVLGYYELEKKYDNNRNNMLILFSDGYGIHPIDSVVEMSRSYNQKGIQIAVVGVGEDYNQSLLSELTAENGNLFNHVGTGEEISTVFTEQLMGLLTPVGSDAKIEIFYNDIITLNTIYGATVSSNLKNVATIKIGNIYDGFTQVLMVKFNLNNISENIENKPVKIRFSYLDRNNQLVEIVSDAFLKWNNSQNSYQLVINDEMKNKYAIVLMNKAIYEMAVLFENENVAEAKQELVKCKEQIDDLSPDMGDINVIRLYDKLNLYINAINNYIKNQK